MPARDEAPVPLLRVGATTAAAVYLLLFFEWLFQVTKPSMFELIDWPQKIAILLAAGILVALPVAALAVLVAFAWSRFAAVWRRHAAAVALVIPAAVLAACGLLLIDNFTRTVFGFNVGSFVSPVRYLYAVGLLLLAVRLHRALARLQEAAARRGSRALAVVAAALLLVSAAAAWLRYQPRQGLGVMVADGDRELPNILIFSSDGLNAANMSVYGYERSTTPFLESRADEFLISENHFSNAAETAASIGSLLTGKLPAASGMMRGGDALRGEHVFQHLPGVLRQLGYFNVDISARYWGDAYDMNMRQGFHAANGRSLRNETLPLLGWMGGVYSSEFYFVSQTMERLRERVLHAFGLADMEDFFNVVANKFGGWKGDSHRLRLLRAALSSPRRPFFAHVHLLDTHHVPLGEVGGEADPYDEALARYDGYLRQLVAELDAAGELDRTLLVVNSDHDSNRTGEGRARRTRTRLPLMIRFPHAEHRGRIRENTQRIDVAPTILSYLGVEPPAWMTGRSLIDGDLDPLRPILGTDLRWRRSVRIVSLVQCQRAWEFRMQTATLEQYPVTGHTAPCAEAELLDAEEARAYLFGHLELSTRFALSLSRQLESLRQQNSRKMRRQVTRSILDGEVPALWLGRTIAVSRLHSDFWTRGTLPGVVLLKNDGDEPHSFELVVGSGRDQEFPASFFVQDDEATREFTFSRAGFMSVDLGQVGPRSERLIVVWAERSWGKAAPREPRGVRLLPTGAWLRDLLRNGRREEWRQAARLMLDRRVPTARMADGWQATNVHGDLWTRGREPAGLAIPNPGSEPLTPRLVLRSGRGHTFPLRVELHDGSQSRDYVFAGPGRITVELPQVPPGAERLFIIRSERGWTQDSGAPRELGVRLSSG